MKIAPIGIFALIAAIISELGAGVILPLLRYLAVYGMATASFMILWIVFISVTCRLNPFRLIKNMLPMSVMALATTSSAITLPMAITVVTISQIYGVEYGYDKIIYIGVISALVSLANAVVPGAGLVSLAIIIPQITNKGRGKTVPFHPWVLFLRRPFIF